MEFLARKPRDFNTVTIPWDSASLARNYPGVIVRQHESLYVNTTQIGNYGIVERAVLRGKEGTSAVLLQLGLDNERWSADSMECLFHLLNIQDFSRPISEKDLSRWHQSGSKVLRGKLLCRAFHAWWIWKGDIMVADIQELEVTPEGSMQKKCSRRNEAETSSAQSQAKQSKSLSGGDERLRTSPLFRERRERR